MSIITPVFAAPECSFCEFINISKGDPGINGTDGYTPIFGVDYFNGTNGTDGYTPIFGVDYFNGTDGQTGPIGLHGLNGTPASIIINATFNGLPGSAASVVNIGNTTDASLDFIIPTGYNGSELSLGGTDTQIIYNNNMAANGSPCLTFNYTTLTLSACNITGDGTGVTNVTASAIALSFTVREGGVGDISKGQPVYISGSTGTNIRVLPTDNTITDKSRVVGLMVQSVSINELGQVRIAGELSGIDTRSSNTIINPLGQTWSAGDLLFATNNGGLTNVRPTSGRSVKVAYSLKGSHLSDTLLVHPMENPVWLTAATAEDVVTRLGDSAGINKLSIRNYSNGEVSFINSYGNASFNGIDNNLYRLTNVRDPVALQDAATRNFVNTVNTTMKLYVDSIPSGGDTSSFLFINGSRWMGGNLNMSKFNVSNITSIASGDAVNLTTVTNMNISVNNYIDNVNTSMRNNVSRAIATTTNLSAVYPIGSVYITTSSDNPNTIFGGFGTWNDLGNGYVLVGV